MNRKRDPSVDEQLLRRIQTSKQAQAFAGKIEKCVQKKGEGRALVKSLVEKWAELVKVRSYFPDLKDAFTPEAIFCIEYAHRQGPGGDAMRIGNHAARVRDVVVYVSNLVGNHDTDFKTLARLYNSMVNRWEESRELLPLIGEQSQIDGRLSGNKPLFIPPGASAPSPKKPREKKRSQATEYTVDLPTSYNPLGLCKGDSITFKTDGTAPIGKLIGVYTGKKAGAWLARVCLNDKRGIFLLLRSGEHGWLADYEYKSFGPVVKIERASEVNAKRIAALKERLEKVRRNDWDSICDTTRLFELERELYALEHPKDEDVARPLAPGDDWPEVIEEYSPEEKMQAREASRLIRELVTKIYERDGEEGLKKLRQDVDEYFSVNSKTGEGGGQQ